MSCHCLAQYTGIKADIPRKEINDILKQIHVLQDSIVRTNGVRYSQVFARILENAGKQKKVTLVTAQVNFRK